MISCLSNLGYMMICFSGPQFPNLLSRDNTDSYLGMPDSENGMFWNSAERPRGGRSHSHAGHFGKRKMNTVDDSLQWRQPSVVPDLNTRAFPHVAVSHVASHL